MLTPQHKLNTRKLWSSPSVETIWCYTEVISKILRSNIVGPTDVTRISECVCLSLTRCDHLYVTPTHPCAIDTLATATLDRYNEKAVESGRRLNTFHRSVRARHACATCKLPPCTAVKVQSNKRSLSCHKIQPAVILMLKNHR